MQSTPLNNSIRTADEFSTKLPDSNLHRYKYANRLRKMTQARPSGFGETIRHMKDEAEQLTPFDIAVYNINPVIIEQKLTRDIDYVYYYNKVSQVLKMHKKHAVGTVHIAKSLYLLYKYTNDHFDIIVKDDLGFINNLSILPVLYNKIEEHAHGIKNQETILNIYGKAKLYRKITKQISKFRNKYEQLQARRNRFQEFVLENLHIEKNIPKDVVQYVIKEFLV